MRRLLAASLLLAACSSTPDPGTPNGEAEARAVCDRIHGRICAGLKSCDCRLDVRGHSDEADCVVERSEECMRGMRTRAVLDLQEKRVVVDSASVDACAAGVDALAGSCRVAGQNALPSACNELFTDVAAIGETCRVEGGGFLSCAGGDGICTGSGARTCTSRPAAGSPCLGSACARGLVCDSGTCRAPGSTGATCGSDETCGSGLACVDGTCAVGVAAEGTCTRTAECATGLRCESGKCVAASAIDAACSTADACGAGRSCGLSPESRTCRDPATKGEACEQGTCAVGLVCDAELGTCVDEPGDGVPCDPGTGCSAGFTCSDGERVCRRLPRAGEACAMGDRFCADGFGCNETTQTCEAGGGDGAACLLNPPDYVCAEGFGCDFTENGSICKPLAATGPCNTDRTCAADAYCNPEGACTSRLPEGSSCSQSNECARGFECARDGSSWRCSRIPTRDEPCTSTCATGLACRGAGGQCVPTFCVMP